MIKKILDILERDSDITYREEFHYIYITIKETISILRNGNKL
jgi:homospermidine synthase